MIDNVQTPAMNLPAAPKQAQPQRLLRWPSILRPPVRWPSVTKKALVSAAILAVTASVVLIRAQGMSRTNVPEISQASKTPTPATEPLPATTAGSTSASSECADQVWPYISAACLQGQTQPDAARMAVGTQQPDASKPSQTANENLLETSKPEQLRAEPERLSREERRARRYEERRARYEEQRAQYEARYDARRARYDERRTRRYEFGF